MPILGGAMSATPLGVSYLQPFPHVSYATTQIGIGTIQIVPFSGQGAYSAADIYVSGAFSATNAGSSQAQTVSAFLGVYTKNAASLSLASSGSITYALTVTGSSSSVSFQGLKNLTIPITAQMTPGNYWYAVSSSTASAGNAIALGFSNVVNSVPGQQSVYQGVFGQSTFASEQAILGYGSYSVTSGAFPAAIGFSEILGSALGGTAAPVVNFKNYTV